MRLQAVAPAPTARDEHTLAYGIGDRGNRPEPEQPREHCRDIEEKELHTTPLSRGRIPARRDEE